MYLQKPNHLDILELYNMVNDDLSQMVLSNLLNGVDNVEIITCKQNE